MRSNLHRELAADLAAERYDITEQGVYFPRQSALAAGEYFDRTNGGKWARTSNLIPVEGLAHMLNVALGTTPKPAAYYIALFAGTAAPAGNWAAASFAATANELVSLTEGYTGATRPAWTPVNTAGNSIDNMAGAAQFTIATASTLNVSGAALLTASGKGATTGALVSASKYAAARTFQDGDTYEVGYRMSLTV